MASWLPGYKYRQKVYTGGAVYDTSYWWDYEYWINGIAALSYTQAAGLVGVDLDESVLTENDGLSIVLSLYLLDEKENSAAWTAGALLDPSEPTVAQIVDHVLARTAVLTADNLLPFPRQLDNNIYAGVGYIYWGRTTAVEFDPLVPEYWDLFDHFDDASIDTDKWDVTETGTGAVSEASTSLVFTIPNDASDLSVKSDNAYSQGVDVTMLVTPVSNAYTTLFTFECGLHNGANYGIYFKVLGPKANPTFQIFVADGISGYSDTLAAIWSVNDEIKVRITYTNGGTYRIWLDDVEYDLPTGSVPVDTDELKVTINSRITNAFSYNLESKVDYIALLEIGSTEDDDGGIILNGDEESNKIGGRPLEPGIPSDPWVIKQGSIFHEQYTWRDANGDVYDLSDYAVKCEIRKTKTGSVITTPTVTLGGSLGTISIDLTSIQTRAITFTRAVMEVEVSPGGGNTHTAADVVCILSGPITMDKEIVQ